MKFIRYIFLYLISFNLFAIPITNEAIVEADQLITLDSTYVTVKGPLELEAESILKHITTPANPAVGFLKLYSKSDNLVYKLDSAGNEELVGLSTIDLTTDVTGTLPIANGGTGSATQNFVDLTLDQIISGVKNFASEFLLDEVATPSNPAVGKNKLYFKADGNLYKLDDTGAEAQVGGDSSPTTTEGDIIFRGASADERRSIGSEGSFLVSANGVPKWSNTLQGVLNPVTDWVPFTPTGSWVTAVTYAGIKKQVGDEVYYKIKVTTSGATTAASLTLNIDDGTIDTAKLFALSNQEDLGSATIRDDSSGTRYMGRVFYNSNSTVLIGNFLDTSTLETTSVLTNNSLITFAANDEVVIEFKVPIVGLSSGVDAVAQNKTSALVFAEGSAGVLITPSVTNIPFTESKDDENTFNGTEFTAPRSGRYSFDGLVQGTASTTNLVEIYKDTGSGYVFHRHGSSISTSARHKISFTEDLNTGDKIVFRVSSNALTTTSTVSSHWLSISEDSHVIAAAIDSQKWECSDQKTLSGNITSITDIADWTFNVSTGKKYSISLQANLANAAEINIQTSSTVIGRIRFPTGSITTWSIDCVEAENTIIKARSLTTNTINAGGLSDSWMQICELPDNYICNSTKFD